MTKHASEAWDVNVLQTHPVQTAIVHNRPTSLNSTIHGIEILSQTKELTPWPNSPASLGALTR